MDTYVAILHKDDDSAFGAYVPDLTGCFAAGDTEDEALANLRISLRIYAEDMAEQGRKLPRASSLHDILKDAEVRADVAKHRGVLVLVPLLVGGKKRRVNITLEPSLIAAVDDAATAAGTNRSDYLASAAWSKVKNETGAVRIGATSRKASAGAKRTKEKARRA